MTSCGVRIAERSTVVVVRAVILIGRGVECPECIYVLWGLGERDRLVAPDAVIGVRLGSAGFAHHNARIDERGKDLGSPELELRLLLRGLQGCLDQLEDAGPGVTALLDLGEHHGVRDAQPRLEHLRFTFDEAREGRLVPGDKALRRLLLLEPLHLLGVAHGLELGFVVLDLELGRLGDDDALGVKARPPRAPGDLVEFA